MFQIVNFYFSLVASLFTDVMQKFEIFPGIGYGVWLFGVVIFCSFIAIFWTAFKRDMNNMAYTAVKRNRIVRYREKHPEIRDKLRKRK